MKKSINNKTKGFTIVELLVVIVVIGILAAISIVSYTGVTTKARNSSAKSQAVAVQSAAESFFALNGTNYPFELTDFSGGATADGMSIKFGADAFRKDAPSADKSNYVQYFPCGASAPTDLAGTTGAKIFYYNSDGNEVIEIGDTSDCKSTALGS